MKYGQSFFFLSSSAEPKCKITPAGLQGKLGLGTMAPSSRVVTLSSSLSSRAVCPLRPEQLIVFHSAALQGGDPTAPGAEDHYVVWHHRACHTIQNPQWCSWVNWFLALQSTFRLEYRGGKRHWMQKDSLSLSNTVIHI